jgi:integrase/recombinase XerC
MDILAQFEAHLKARDRSPATVRGYLADLRQFDKWIGKNRGLKDTRTADIQGYRQHMLEAGKSANTINRRLASLAAFGHWGANTARIFDENPALYVSGVDNQVLAPRWLDDEQRKQFLKVIKEEVQDSRERYPRLWLIRLRDSVMVHTLLNTGLRVGELCALRLDDLTISERKGSVLVRAGKGRKQRSVPLQVEMRKQLAEWLEVRPSVETDHVFIGQRGEAVTARVVQRVVARYAEAAGLEDVTPHSLRHTFGRMLLDNGASLLQVSMLMGHKNLNSTARYLQPAERELQEVVDLLAG